VGAEPLRAQPPGTAARRLQANRRRIAACEGRRSDTRPARHGAKPRSGPAAPAWDTAAAPGWWLEPDASRRQHRPAPPARPHRGTRPGTAPADLGFDFRGQGSSGTACPVPPGPAWHGAVQSPIQHRGSTGNGPRRLLQHPSQHRERASAAAPASQPALGLGSCSGIPASTGNAPRRLLRHPSRHRERASAAAPASRTGMGLSSCSGIPASTGPRRLLRHPSRHRERASAAAPASQPALGLGSCSGIPVGTGNGPRRLLRHPSAQPQPGHLTATGPRQRGATTARTPPHPYPPPRFPTGTEAQLQLGELGSSRLPQPRHEPRENGLSCPKKPPLRGSEAALPPPF